MKFTDYITEAKGNIRLELDRVTQNKKGMQKLEQVIHTIGKLGLDDKDREAVVAIDRDTKINKAADTLAELIIRAMPYI